MGLSEAQINGRFRYLERPAALPGKCACCGSVDKPVIDFGFDLDFYGVVYLCVSCLGEATSIVEANSEGAEPQIVPPPTVDLKAVDEYLRAATDASSRLCAILPAAYFDVEEEHSDDAGVSAEESSDDGGNVPSPQVDDNSQPEPVSVEGPDDSSDAKRSGSVPSFSL